MSDMSDNAQAQKKPRRHTAAAKYPRRLGDTYITDEQDRWLDEICAKWQIPRAAMVRHGLDLARADVERRGCPPDTR